MTIRWLKTFLAVAQTGSFVSASQNIGLTQAAISIQMKNLEDELRVQLFDRSSRKVILTHAGHLLVPRVVELLRLYENIAQNLDDQGLGGKLTVGAIPPTFAGLLPDALLELRERHPNIAVHVSTGVSSELMYKVEREELDLAIVGRPPHRLQAGMVWEKVAAEPLVLLAPVSREKNLSLPEVLAEHAFISLTRSSWSGHLIHAVLRRYRFRVRVSMELDSIETITGMVARGFGVSILPLASARWNPDKRVTVMPLIKPTITREIGVIYRTGSERHLLINALSESLLRVPAEPVIERRGIELPAPPG